MDGLVLAHTLGAGGPEIELLVVAVALMWMGVLFYFRKAVKPIVSVVLVIAALVLAGGSFVLGGSARSGAGIDVSIASPPDGTEIQAGRPVRLDVDVAGGRIVSSTTVDDPAAGHIHVYVDDEIVSMPTTASPRVELERGSHTITVEFVDVDHVPFDPRIQDQIRVEAV